MIKLIEYLIVCDNEKCDFNVTNETGDPNANTKHFLNAPCPKCGEILLTEKDYLDYNNLLTVINWYNKWFSWLVFFIPKRKKNVKTTTVYVHDGISINVK